jgi:hypothetical protein
MSQKKRVRVYKPGQIDNSMNSWFMQMGGMPQQPQQQDMATQIMQYAQQMIRVPDSLHKKARSVAG